MAFYSQTVDVLRPPMTTNRANEEIPDYRGLADAPGVPRDRAHVRPTSQDELPAEDRETAMSEWRIGTAPGSGDWDIRSGDWVRLPDGTIAAVQGDPARPVDPVSGSVHHVEVLVRAERG